MPLKSKEELKVAKQYILIELIQNEISATSGKSKCFSFHLLVITFLLKYSFQSYYFCYLSETISSKRIFSLRSGAVEEGIVDATLGKKIRPMNS